MDAASSGAHAQSESGCVAPTSVATVVPHDPAPITATRSTMHKRLGRPRSGPGVRPYTGSVPKAIVPSARLSVVSAGDRVGPEVVLIPVKAFHQAKKRLGPALSDAERVALVRAMASHVVSACAPLPVAVVCDDEAVARWASDLGATVMWEPGQGLNGAVRAGVDRLAGAGAQWVTVAHGDLPRARRAGDAAALRGRHPRAGPPRRRDQRAAAPHGV